MIGITKYLIFLILSMEVLFSCEKEKIALPVSYNKITSEVGPQGKTIHFIENSSNIPDDLFPTLEIAPNTFIETAVIQLYYEKILSGNIPPELTSISKNNILWHFKSNKQILKPVILTIPFPDPDSLLMLTNYKYLFKLYRIFPEKDTKVFSNWDLVSTSVMDTSNNTISTTLESFGYSYCVQFEEIKLEDACILSVDGYIKDLCRWGDNSYIKFGNSSGQYGCFVSWDGVSYYNHAFKSKDVDGYIAFSFNANSIGTYSGDNVNINYFYSKNTQGEWQYRFTNTYFDTIKISKFGNIGDFIEGNIKGRVQDYSKKEVVINMDFIFKRAR